MLVELAGDRDVGVDPRQIPDATVGIERVGAQQPVALAGEPHLRLLRLTGGSDLGRRLGLEHDPPVVEGRGLIA